MMYLLISITGFFVWIAESGYETRKEMRWAWFSICSFSAIILLYAAGFVLPLIAYIVIGSVMLAGHLLANWQSINTARLDKVLIAAILAVCFWPFALAYIKSKHECCGGES